MQLEKALLSIPEFMAWASISRSQVYREIKAGKLRLTKRGRRSFIARQDAEAWLASLRTISALRSVADDEPRNTNGKAQAPADKPEKPADGLPYS